MKRFGKLLSFAAAAVVLTAFSGCDDDLVVAARDVGAVASHDDRSVTIHDLGGVANRWHVSEDALRGAAKTVYLSETWLAVNEHLYDDLRDLNEKTEGPARDIIIETACDLAAERDFSSDEVSEKLNENAKKAGKPWVVRFLTDAQEVTQELQTAYDPLGNAAQKQQSRATVAIGCKVNSTLSDLKAAFG